MDKYIINGGRKIDGSVNVQSAKNSVLPLIAGALLTTDEVIIENCPKISDVLSMLRLLKKLGVDWRFEEDNLIINSSGLKSCELKNELTKELRSSIFLLGSLVSRTGCAKLAYPGGCDIGLRPIDLHILALKQLGVKITEYGGQLNCFAEKIIGNEIYLDFPSVGATENIMLASTTASGVTIINNPAKEPEIKDLMHFLNKMGAKISGAGSDRIYIEGVKSLHGVTYKPIADRIEAGTLLIAGAITGGNIEVRGINHEILSPVLNKLLNNTCKITIKSDIIYLKSGSILKGFNVETNPYPGFPTDLQAQALALACVSKGVSIIRENIFETRFKHVSELIKLGAKITVKDRVAIVNGIDRFIGGDVYACDLRGGASLVLAGLNAKGVTVVHDIKHVERGYYRFDQKLRSLNCDIFKI